MEWQQITGFYHVARLGSFTRAAEATFRTQSALSQQVKALEEEFECRLFERIGKRKLKLTPAGEKFYKFSEVLMEKYSCLVEEMNELKQVRKGRLKIAAPFSTLYHLLPEVLRTYMKQYPFVELTVLDRPPQSVVALVHGGDVDFGLALEAAIPKDLAVLRWKRVETVIMAPPGHPLTKVKRVTAGQLCRYPLILPPRDVQYTGRSLLEEYCQATGAKYQIAIECSNVELSSVYVEMGLGISFATVASELSALKQRKLEFIPLDHCLEPGHIAVLMRKDKELTPLKSAFLNILMAEAVG